MANPSIFAAFERMWQHVVSALGHKAEIDHDHNDTYYTEAEIDEQFSSVNAAIDNMANGTTPVQVAVKAEQDAAGNVITDTYETKSDAQSKFDEAKGYTDEKIADLINGAPTTLNTLGEIADAMEENADVVEALDNAIGTKANASDLTAHTGNITVHITDSERSTWNAIEGKVKTYTDGLVADKATVAYVDEQVSDKATMEYVDNTVPLMIDIVTSTNDAGAMTFTLPEEWNFATLQAQWAAGRLVVLKANNLLYICGAISDTLMRFETVYEAQYRAKEAYVRSYFTLTSDNAFNYHSTIIRHPTYVRFYNSNGVNYLDGYTFDDLNTMVDNNYPVFLYRVFTDNIKYVYHFHKKSVSNGVTSLIFYYQDGLNLYQAVVKSDGGFSNGYYALVASSRTINGKPLSANIVLTPEDIGAAGHIVAGSVYTIDGVEYTANAGAEVFNNYNSNKAVGLSSHAEGNVTIALGNYSHAEGSGTIASGICSHAEGMSTQAIGYESHAEGYSTIAGSLAQHAQGRYNIEDSNNIYAHIVGNGYSSADRSNAHTLDWDGNAWYAGDIKIGGSSYDDADAKTVSTTDHRHSWNELKNRPFYESDSCTVGSYRGGYVQVGADGIKTARLHDVALDQIEAGATYHITFLEQDSPYAEIASYDWVAKEWNSTSNDPYYVGNPIIYADSGSLGEDSGEPAVLYTRDGAAYMAIDTRREPLTAITGLLNVVISKDAGLKTIDEKYIPDSIARTDHIHSWDELGERKEYGMLISEAEVTIGDEDNYTSLPYSVSLIEDEVYTVSVNNVEYQLTAWRYDNWEAVCLGNGQYIDGIDLGDPNVNFGFDSYSDGECYINANPGDYIVSISGLMEQIELIDQKYLPNTIAYMSDIEDIQDNLDEHLDNTESHVTFDEKSNWNAAVAALDEAIMYKNATAAMPSDKVWRNLAYGNGKFVAVAWNSTEAAYSTDGFIWHTSTMPVYCKWHSVTYGDGKFVAVAENSSNAAYSTDGITWYKSTMPSSTTSWYSIIYGNGKFVAIAYNSNVVAYSTDGITWYESAMPQSAYWYSVAYGNGKFVATAGNSTEVAVSSDGINWNTATVSSTARWRTSIAYGNGKFVAVGNSSSEVAVSADGVNWNTYAALPSNSWSVVFGGDKFIAVADNSDVVAYSTDGINWSTSNMPIVRTWFATYGNGRFVATVSSYETVAISTDGINWTDSIECISNLKGVDITENIKSLMTGGLASETYVDEAVAEKVTKTSLTLSLPIASWSNNSITVTATGVTADNTIFVAPAPASQADYTAAGVMCTAQAANSLTFTCTSAPTADLSVNVVIFD